MELFNVLSKAVPVFGQTFDVSLNWVGQFIRLLVTGVGTVGVGVILFSLILKFVVLPFDVFQRISMRKQNQKMKEQKDYMEKLQKQYANNQEMYNQKVMEMYKENGISMFSSCLPMILSMVIFFVAIGAFNSYSQYSSVQNYNELAKAYNAKLESYCPDLDSATLSFADGKIVVKGESYLYYTAPAKGYTEESDAASVKAYIQSATGKEYYIDVTKASSEIEAISSAVSGEVTAADAAYNYFVGEAQSAVVEAYEGTVSENTRFLWIKNVWATDAAHVHPLLTYQEFKTKANAEKLSVNGEDVSFGDVASKGNTNVYSEDAYNLITAKLSAPKAEANGYYILIALSILTILLQQFITMRSQKEQNALSTVDGQGASQQKMMMIMMTGMFAVFSFMYSAAFSLYLVISNVFSLCSTLIINKVVDTVMEKKSTQETIAKLDNRGLSRIEKAKLEGIASAQESRERKAAKEAEEKSEDN